MSAAAILLTVACIALLLTVKTRTVGYNTFAAIFIVFFALYGVTVPLADVLGLPTLNSNYPSAHATGRFLLAFALALTGLAAGLLTVLWAAPRAAVAQAPKPQADDVSRALFLAAIVLAGLASLFELVNLERVGGLAALGFGKAVYQSKVDELSLTLPSYIVANVAVAAMSLHLARELDRARRAALRRLAWFAVALGPALVLAVAHTRRTEIIAWILIAFVGLTWTRSVRRITATLAAVVLAAYLLSPALVATRQQNAPFGMLWWEVVWREANPGIGEFSTPFGMFNEYVTRMPDAPPRWGMTYVNGIASVVPGRLWPGDKPRQIDMETRDVLFPAYIKGASLESAGFSAILEALVNFGTWGIAPVFAAIGAAIGALETQRTRFRPAVAPMFYLSLLPIAQTFHRSAFGPAVLSVGAMTVLALALFLAVYVPLARRDG